MQNSQAYGQEVNSLDQFVQSTSLKPSSVTSSKSHTNADDKSNFENPNSVKKTQLTEFCQRQDGVITEPFYCPTSQRKRTGAFCKIQDNQGRDMFFNGCTGADKIPFGKTFFKACVLHDFCYHHEPTSNGLSKDYCDKKLLKDMRTICDKQENNSFACNTFADLFYAAVRTAGNKSWNCSKVPANYPKNLSDLDDVYFDESNVSLNLNKDILDIISAN